MGIGKVMFLRPKKEFLDNLKSNNKTLLNISEDFIKIVDRYRITSFYEEDKIGGIAIVSAAFFLTISNLPLTSTR